MSAHRKAAEDFLAQRALALDRLAARLRACSTPHDLAWTVCDYAGRALELDDLIVYLIDADGRTLLQHAAWGAKRVAERMIEHRITLRVGQGIVGSCALTGTTQLVPDTRLDPRYVADDESRLSELAVAIRHDGRVLGVIDSESDAAYAFDTPQQEALEAIAAVAADALAMLAAPRR
jgi:putative methionine-R-sulfoxide reductase with GAF domain